MTKTNNRQKFNKLRLDYPYLSYDGFDYQYSEKGLRVQFRFSLSGKYSFSPTMIIPSRDFFIEKNLNNAFLENILFHIGMVESISYWKAACPPKLILRCGSLSEEQVKWWKKLFFKGLGEFRFLNSITVQKDAFLQIENEQGPTFNIFHPQLEESAIVPVGGGKDSVVTLELLGKDKGNLPMILNPREASKGTVMKMGLYYDSIVEVNRTIDPVLLEMNEAGFLNGHTPFSALIAFVSVLAAVMSGKKYIALSNESSANESTVRESEINHQYSKSIEFEADIRNYISSYIAPEIDYFSFLRPLNELQIARLFSEFPRYFDVFKSCNVGSKTDSWCGKCAKCLFTYIVLSPFLSPETLVSVFGKNLLEDEELVPTLNQLIGRADTKPFECIGTVDEVNAAMQIIVGNYSGAELPALLKHYKESEDYSRYLKFDTSSLLQAFNKNHFLPGSYETLLRSKIHA